MAAIANPLRQDEDPRVTARAAGRAAALLALCSALIHLLLVDVSQLGSLALVGMALACLPCAWHLWRSPSGGVWALTAAADATMLVVHAQLHVSPSHHTAHLHTTAVSGQSGLMWLGLGLVAAQLALAAFAGLPRPRALRSH